MLKRFTACLAPKEYLFRDPDTKHPFQGTSIADVASKVRMYRMQNELEELPFLEAVIESYLCTLPSNLGGCEPLPTLKRGFFETLRGGVAVIKAMMYKSFASQEIADARAEICLTCPLNTVYNKEDFDAWCDDIAEQTVGDRRSKHHSNLGICAGCNCGLRFKVFYNEPIKLTKKQQKTISVANPACWQLKS